MWIWPTQAPRLLRAFPTFYSRLRALSFVRPSSFLSKYEFIKGHLIWPAHYWCTLELFASYLVLCCRACDFFYFGLKCWKLWGDEDIPWRSAQKWGLHDSLTKWLFMSSCITKLYTFLLSCHVFMEVSGKLPVRFSFLNRTLSFTLNALLADESKARTGWILCFLWLSPWIVVVSVTCRR